MRRIIRLAVVMLAGSLATTGAFAQGAAAPSGEAPGARPMQGGMCGPGGMCGMGTPTQATPTQATPMPGMTPMPGVTQGQGGMMMGGMMAGGCPMMQRMAAMDTRLRQLEDRAGVPVPPSHSHAPGTVH